MSTRSARRAPAPMIRKPQGAGVGAPDQPGVRRLQGALELPIEQVRPDARQPRQNWEHADGKDRLAELVSSIAEFGVLQPILVGPEAEGADGAAYYPLIAGNRRVVAARLAGLATVPAIIRSTAADDIRILQLTENLQRQELAPLDEARAYQELCDLQRLSPPQLAARLHVSETLVRNRLHLLDDQILADAVERRQISATAARQILQLPDEERLRFRQRVAAGERVQSNDLATSRARLRAEGVDNPRRSPRPALPLRQVTSTPSVADANSSDTSNGRTSCAIVPSSVGGAAPEAARADGAGAAPAPPPEAAAPEAAAPAPAEGETLAGIVAGADPQALRLLRRLAHYGEGAQVDEPALPLAVRLLGALLRRGAAEHLSCAALYEAIWSADDE